MTSYARFGKRWTINECLQLQREFELLQLSINEIAKRHQRTPNAIMFKLEQEGFADYNVLYSNYNNLNSTMNDEKLEQDNDEDEDSEDEDEDDNSENDELDCESLQSHIVRLEKQVIALTEIVMKQTKNNKSVFSLFS
jgi:hypothetical protein